MHPSPWSPLASLAVLLAAAGPAAAQTAPPIKPGLWQVHTESLVDGKKAPDMSEQFAKMPPAQRARMEAMLKQRGIDVSAAAGGDLKVCLNRESLDSGQWQGKEGSCKTDYLTRSASSWTWHTSCSQPKVEADGEARFESPERYTVKMISKVVVQGAPSQTQTTLTSKWLGADCGSVKPISAKP